MSSSSVLNSGYSSSTNKGSSLKISLFPISMRSDLLSILCLSSSFWIFRCVEVVRKLGWFSNTVFDFVTIGDFLRESFGFLWLEFWVGLLCFRCVFLHSLQVQSSVCCLLWVGALCLRL